ncbi:hypothetical protein CAL22_18955 [Bordetella genomosp. 12]|uniref:Uncharacterized protein n=1 Tax=Bordetella genomosp. 12 TaxID=463035 RepID=A0A261VCJ4_9BORD|nr:hypothetical protein CAL22_18955 [Bordetella genomosp. 12]
MRFAAVDAMGGAVAVSHFGTIVATHSDLDTAPLAVCRVLAGMAAHRRSGAAVTRRPGLAARSGTPLLLATHTPSFMLALPGASHGAPLAFLS